MSTEKIWKEFNAQLLNFIKTKINDSTLAEDILQDVFIKIHLKSSTLNESIKIQSWLYQITRNTIVDYYRKKKIPLSNELNYELAEIEEPNIGSDFTNCLLPFINQLPQKYREAILKTELGTLSQKEYASVLGISYSATKSRVQRAKQKLKEQFITCCDIQLNEDPNCSC